MVNFLDERLPMRFWDKVVPEPNSGCWLWIGSSIGNGYGDFFTGRQPNSKRRMTLAHRVSYEALVGPIQPGLQLDHLCRARCCVNPLHLEPVTQQENIRRGDAGGHAQRKKSTCRNGHPYSGLDEHGYRKCKTCRADQARAKYRRDKEKGLNNER